jgi:site-specific DNA recombinase
MLCRSSDRRSTPPTGGGQRWGEPEGANICTVTVLGVTTQHFIAGYGRISSDEEGKGEGVDNQHRWFEEWAAETHPGIPTRWFEDNDVTGAKADRGGLTDLREYVQRGEVLDLWTRDQSRFQRGEELWFAFKADLVEAGIETFATRHHGRVEVESVVTSIQACVDADRKRQDRKHLMDRQRADAERGCPPYGRVFGYIPVRDDAGNLIRPRTLEIVDAEAEVIRYCATEILSGRSTSSLAKELDRRGVKGARGRDRINTSAQVESLVSSATVAGLRRYNKELVLGDDGRPLQGNWPPILAREVWEDVRAIIAERRKGRQAASPQGGFERRRYILAGLIVCRQCDEKMAGVRKPKKGGHAYLYRCRTAGHGTVSMQVADRVALDVVAERLAAAADALADALRIDEHAGRRDEIHVSLEAIDGQRAQARQDHTDGLHDRAEYVDMLRRLGERRDALRAELDKLVTPTSASDPEQAGRALDKLRQAHLHGDPEAAADLRLLAGDWLTRVVVGPWVEGLDPESRVTVI